jgi:hypothetical protein
LYEAVKVNQVDIVLYLLSRGANVNAIQGYQMVILFAYLTISEEKATPLMIAQSPEIIELLLASGADPLHRAAQGYSCTISYAWGNHAESLETFLLYTGSSILMDQTMIARVEDYYCEV